MHRPTLRHLLAHVVEIRPLEVRNALLMFAYAFFLMASYNIVQPLTRSKAISDLGAANIPYVVFISSLIIGVVMLGYTKIVSMLPRRWALPIAQTGMAGVMVLFWALFQTGGASVSVAFYLWGLILGILLISQFWTLANGIFDPRQAKRLFGFIGGGVTLGGATGAWATALYVKRVGTNALLLWSATVLVACALLVAWILRSERPAVELAETGAREKGIRLRRASELLRTSRQIQLIALVISFGSLGAALIDQQLNMATELFQAGQEDAMGAFLAQVRGYLSLIAFVLQVWITPRIHRYVGIGFALMMLPAGLTTTGATILLASALWAPAMASILDRSVRYTVDKTTREVLFLPLPAELRQEVKPFVDVTVDRLSRGVGALLMLVLIQPWGFSLQWYQLSFASLGLAGVWFVLAVRAKREYLASFRRSIERQEFAPAEGRVNVGDLATIETLLEELASPDGERVLYTIDLLESLQKRNLITPLLLNHESPAVRTRALQALASVRPEVAERWIPSIQRMIAEPSPEVRAAALAALANVRNQQVAELARPYLYDKDPRIATTAAIVLGRSGREEDIATAEAVLRKLSSDATEDARRARKEVARAVAEIRHPRFKHLLIPLLRDTSAEVAEEALRSVSELGSSDFLFVPALVSLLRHRQLKGAARQALAGYGEEVLEALNHFLRDPQEDIWVRRHIPGTIAGIPSQKSIDVLIDALEEPDGFLRYKVVAAVEKLKRDHPELAVNPRPVELLAQKEAARYFNYLTLHYNLFVREDFKPDNLLAHALQEKMRRTVDRVYRLLGVIYPWKDIAAARWSIERGDTRSRASALEYLDNLLKGNLQRRLIPMLEDQPLHEKVRKANLIVKTRARDAEETLLHLIHDDDPVIAAAAIHLVEDRKLWSLAGDIEFVLAHRDPKDGFALEAASWALAACRLTEGRRHALWLEPLPAVELAARLSQIPLFASVSVDELFRIAGLGRQVRHPAGRTLFQEGAVPDEVQFLLDGTVSLESPGGDPGEIAPPAALGLEEILKSAPMRQTVRTTKPTASLELRACEVRALASDNTELVEGLFRLRATHAVPASERLVVKGKPRVAGVAAEALTPIEKVLVLEQIAALAGLPATEMLQVAAITRPVRLMEGATLFGELEIPSILTVLAGCLSLEARAEGRASFAEPGDTIGVHETLAGVPLERKAVVARTGMALKIERDELFELMSQRPALLQHLLALQARVQNLPL